MLLLAVDSSGKHGSLALAQCEGVNCDLIEAVAVAGGTFSAQLVPQIARLLSDHGLCKSDLGGFVAVTGPGSFTGLRVGLAAVKAMAEVLAKPIAAVSLLEALAVGHAGSVLALIDAGRGEVFAGRYDVTPDEIRLVSEELLKIGDLVDAGDHVVTADEALATLLRSNGIEPRLVDRPGSDTIARLGWRKIQAGEAIAAEDLEANYIRRSDAEIFSPPR
jgi:tRNA threonylcarbamoyladenosine biosynthesis protein TsaB